MYSIIEYEGREINVRQIARPEGWQCRVLISEDGTEYFFDHMVRLSTLFDMSFIHKMTDEEIAGYNAGTLRMADLAEELEAEYHRLHRPPQPRPRRW
ncbi:MAG TPA: hypothetical protein VGC13_11380 [Longimicrobium sp.]|jgi:hypothetical protein|uniref:hypothetical protein n=1 Tax=Longimicrobium sp. TaxID=2029185 RepID=UPI002EDA0081